MITLTLPGWLIAIVAIYYTIATVAKVQSMVKESKISRMASEFEKQLGTG